MSDTRKAINSLKVKPLAWKSIHAEPPKSGTFFVAIPSDGSGARLYVAVDADDQGGVDFLDVEDHEICDVDGIFLSGAVWAEAPEEIVKPFFLRDN
jgi:hypothetical protein